MTIPKGNKVPQESHIEKSTAKKSLPKESKEKANENVMVVDLSNRPLSSKSK